MMISSPFDALHNALSQALTTDLPNVEYEQRDWLAWRSMSDEDQATATKTKIYPMVTKSHRPYLHEVEVIMFPQTWGSTALGYGGIGGAAMTQAYTVIVSLYEHDYCVYFGQGPLAYKVTYDDHNPTARENFMNDIAARSMVAVSKRGKYATTTNIS